ncbi:MAG: FtsX-like permease family protein [Lachnospiraceae bacterium]
MQCHFRISNGICGVLYGIFQSFLSKRRTKELGIYTLLGYRKTTISSLLTFENIFICCGAFWLAYFWEQSYTRELSLALQLFCIYR